MPSPPYLTPGGGGARDLCPHYATISEADQGHASELRMSGEAGNRNSIAQVLQKRKSPAKLVRSSTAKSGAVDF